MKNTNNKYKNEDELILDVVRSEEIAHQQDLVNRLKSRGVSIPQSTLSRRLKKLGIAKIQNFYIIIENKKNIQSPILGIKVSQPNMIVLHTLPGHASSIAFELDQKISIDSTPSPNLPYSSLIGTIAGDDTILIIANGTKNGLDKLLKEIENDFQITQT